MPEKDIPVAIVENAIEADLLQQVLRDRDIPCRIALSDEDPLSVYIGHAAAWQGGYGQVWGYERDAAAIRRALSEIRAAVILDRDPEQA